ncbi:MAG: hypothetical protein ACK4GM_03330 [Tabrizicola sp.]
MPRRKDTEAVLLLIAAGARVTAAGDMLETPLHIAVRNEDVDEIRALIAAGANPDAMSEFGETPRSIATVRSARLTRLFAAKNK